MSHNFPSNVFLWIWTKDIFRSKGSSYALITFKLNKLISVAAPDNNRSFYPSHMFTACCLHIRTANFFNKTSVCRVDGNLLNFHCCNLILASNKAENSIFGFFPLWTLIAGWQKLLYCIYVSLHKQITGAERLQHADVRAYKIKSRPAKCDVTKARIKQSWQFFRRKCWK